MRKKEEFGALDVRIKWYVQHWNIKGKDGWEGYGK